MKKVIIISTSLRTNGNSFILAQQFMKGAQKSGNEVELISLKNKKIDFCQGCLSCQKTGKCFLKDDCTPILEKVRDADVIVWATPVYYYEMSGQMKTLIDRLNPLYVQDYSFRDIYFLSTAAETGNQVFEKALSGLQGWIDCFEKSQLKGFVCCGGITHENEIQNHFSLKEAFELGKQI